MAERCGERSFGGRRLRSTNSQIERVAKGVSERLDAYGDQSNRQSGKRRKPSKCLRTPCAASDTKGAWTSPHPYNPSLSLYTHKYRLALVGVNFAAIVFEPITASGKCRQCLRLSVPYKPIKMSNGWAHRDAAPCACNLFGLMHGQHSLNEGVQSLPV